MAAHESSLNSVYTQQMEHVSPLYDLFELIICNFDELKTLCNLYLSVGNEKSLVKFLSSSNPLFKDFRFNMINWLKNGDIHLSLKFSNSPNKYILLGVYRDILSGCTIRQIEEVHHLSPRSIIRCKSICINYLASSYNNLMMDCKHIA